MKVKYYWTYDSVGEVCEHEVAIVSEDVPCYHCNKTILNGTTCVKLTALDSEVYWLHKECAKDSVET